MEDNFDDPEIAIDCTVRTIDESDGLVLTLECLKENQQPHLPAPVIDLSTLPVLSLPIAVDDPVSFYASIDGPCWVDKYFRLDDENGDPLLIGIEASVIPDEVAGHELLPFPVEIASEVCTPEQASCGLQQRLALDLTIDGEQTRMFDHSHAILGADSDVEVWLNEATRYDELDCTDTPTDWFQFLVAYTG
jgi:hypothetical protein